MGLLIFSILFCSATKADVEGWVAKLNAETKPEIRSMVADVVMEYGPRFGFESDDELKLIVSVIFVESGFSRFVVGSAGEVGMMQVIPADGHVRRSATIYKCVSGDVMCKGNRPDIYTNGRVNPHKLAEFIRKNPRAGIAIGIMEMAHWKRIYEDRLKRRFWDSDYLIPLQHRGWHKRVKLSLGEHIWIVHYNHGARIVFSKNAMGYPYAIKKALDKIG